MSTQSTNQSTALYLFAALSGVLVLAGISTKNDYLFGAGIVSIVAAILATLALKLRESAAQAVERQRIWTQGTPARARIVALRSTGARINQDPQVVLDLEVTAPGQEPYRVQLTTLVSNLAIPRVQPDCQVDVRVDPKALTRVVIDPALTPHGYS